MAVPRPTIKWRGAHPNNFTVGRPGAARDGRNTFHHVVGTRESAVIVFNQPGRGASSHFVVGGDRIDQCVDIANTAWCDGNWDSNLRTISVEHEGGQNGTGPYSAAMYRQAAHLCAWLRENYGVKRYIRHRDVSLKSTACPGGLDVEKIWRDATALIEKYKKPTAPAQPEWMKNRVRITAKTVYAQKAGIYVRNLAKPTEAADSRRFVLNQSFKVTGKTKVGGKEYYITQSSMDTNTGNGLLFGEVADKPYVAPKPTPAPVPTPKPNTPDWVDAMVDTPNRELYVLRATPLIDLEFGRPYLDKAGKEVWYQAGDIIRDISGTTIVAKVTYSLTDYAVKEIQGKRYANANGIKSSDLTTDPKATPPGTPANPTIPGNPDTPTPNPDVPDPTKVDKSVVVAFLESLGKLISEFIAKLKK